MKYLTPQETAARLRESPPREPQGAPYRLNISNPQVRAAYEAYRQRERIPYGCPFSDEERQDFEREYMLSATKYTRGERNT